MAWWLLTVVLGAAELEVSGAEAGCVTKSRVAELVSAQGLSLRSGAQVQVSLVSQRNETVVELRRPGLAPLRRRVPNEGACDEVTRVVATIVVAWVSANQTGLGTTSEALRVGSDDGGQPEMARPALVAPKSRAVTALRAEAVIRQVNDRLDGAASSATSQMGSSGFDAAAAIERGPASEVDAGAPSSANGSLSQTGLARALERPAAPAAGSVSAAVVERQERMRRAEATAPDPMRGDESERGRSVAMTTASVEPVAPSPRMETPHVAVAPSVRAASSLASLDLSMLGGASIGPTNVIAGEGVLGVGVIIGATWGVLLEGAIQSSRGAAVAPGRVEVGAQWLSLSARGRWLFAPRWAMSVALGVRGHRFSAVANDFTVNRAEVVLGFGVVAQASLEFSVAGPLSVVARLRGGVRTNSNRFVVDGLGTVIEIGPAEAGVGLGVQVRL